MSLPQPLESFLAARGLADLTSWGDRADVPRRAIYQFRTGRPIRAEYLARLARVVGESPAVVASLLRAEDA